MSKFTAIALTAAICLPIGALTQREASAQRFVVIASEERAHFSKAQRALHEAREEINASEKANEDVWHDDAGHGRKAMQAIEDALHLTDRASAWATPTCESSPPLGAPFCGQMPLVEHDLAWLLDMQIAPGRVFVP